MSLINDLLVNLEERRGGRGHDNGVFAGLHAADAELARGRGARLRLALLIVSVACLLAVGGYIVSEKMPSMTATDVRANEVPVADQTAPEAEAGEQTTAETTAPLPEWTSLKLDDSLKHTRVDQQQEESPGEAAVVPQLVKVGIDDERQPRLQAIRLEGDDSILHVGLGLSSVPEYRSYILESPDRLVFDMDATELVLESDKLPAHEWIEGIRHSQKDDKLRLVFDLAHPIEIVEEQWVSDSHQLVLKLRALDNTTNGISESDSDPAGLAQDDSQDQGRLSSDDSPVVIADQHISVTESSGKRPQGVSDSYRLARRYYERREFDHAIQTIQRHLQKAPDDELAIKLYALALFQTNQTERADSVLYDATRRLPNANGLKQLYAQWLMQQDKAADALAILHDSPPPLAEAPDYHALLAALQQKLGQHPESADLYRQLVRQVPERGVWWMGLAISLEALDRGDEALDAYQQALKRDLSGDLRQYVSARINALSRAQAS
ncbi:MAG: AMIN domain-containing protein [Gammaproteobacteria bacterium]|nr:AMIN domain-containing protein [Gammaproteobacteria bacterium]